MQGGALLFDNKSPLEENIHPKSSDNISETSIVTVPVIKAAGKTFEPVTYEGAGHGFMRAGEAPDASEPNRKARTEAWARWKSLLAK